MLQKNLKVLILVNEKIVALDIKTILLSQGFKIISTYLPQKRILNKIKTEKPDLIIIDILPNALNENICLIRNIKKFFPTPLILLSTYLEQEILNLLDGMRDISFLQKPFLEQDLINSINEKFSFCIC